MSEQRLETSEDDSQAFKNAVEVINYLLDQPGRAEMTKGIVEGNRTRNGGILIDINNADVMKQIAIQLAAKGYPVVMQGDTLFLMA